MTRPPEPSTIPPQRATVFLSVGFATLAAVFPLLPESIRLWNFALFGALGLFTASRLNFRLAIAITLGAKLACDLISWQLHQRNPDYLPLATVYLTYLVYPLVGSLWLRSSESPTRIGFAVLAASLLFFFVSNFISWLEQALPYGYTLAGLWQCYVNAIPFFRGTILGDALFSSIMFATHAVVARAIAAKPVLE